MNHDDLKYFYTFQDNMFLNIYDITYLNYSLKPDRVDIEINAGKYHDKDIYYINKFKKNSELTETTNMIYYLTHVNKYRPGD